MHRAGVRERVSQHVTSGVPGLAAEGGTAAGSSQGMGTRRQRGLYPLSSHWDHDVPAKSIPWAL